MSDLVVKPTTSRDLDIKRNYQLIRTTVEHLGQSKRRWGVGRLGLNVNNQLYSVSFGELRLIS